MSSQFLLVIGCILIAVCVILSLLEALVVFGFIHKEVKVMVLPGDITSLSLPSHTPPSLDVFLWGQEDTCFAEVFVTNCKDVHTAPKATEHFSDIDYNYFAPGSSVTIGGNNLIRPYQIWLFSNKFDADSAVNEQFHGYNCLSADHGALCAQLNSGEDTATISVTESAYYYICCEQEPFNCSQVENWKIKKMMFAISPEHIINNSTIQVAQSTTDSSKIRLRNYLSTSSPCLFARLNATNCGSHSKYLMDINYSSICREVQVYLALTMVSILIVTPITYIALLLLSNSKRLVEKS